jgi:hypothetical protein
VRAQLLDGSATGVLDTVRRLGSCRWTRSPPSPRRSSSSSSAGLGAFDPDELERLIWEERKLFEYDAFIYPIEDLPLAEGENEQAAPRREA